MRRPDTARSTLTTRINLPQTGPDLARVSDAADLMGRPLESFVASAILTITARLAEEQGAAGDGAAVAAIDAARQRLDDSPTVTWTFHLHLIWPDGGPAADDIEQMRDALGLDSDSYASCCVIAHTELQHALANDPEICAYWAAIDAQIAALPDGFEETFEDLMAEIERDSHLTYDPNAPHA